MFLKDVDNITQFNLDQGKKLLNYNDDVGEIVSPHLKLVQYGSLIEGLNETNISPVDKKSLEGLQNSETQFNKTLALYTQTYKQFNEDMLTKRQSKKQIVDYLGKVISDVDGNNYYVNNFGFTHKYTPNSWENNNSSCPTTPVSYSGSISDFQKSIPMVQGQSCKIAGQNIKNKETSEEAWVDIKGIKHPYSNRDKKNTSCSTNTIKLSGKDYNLIPTGGAMSDTDQCIALDVNPVLWYRLQELNTKLKHQSLELTQEINNLTLEDNDTKQQLMDKRQQLITYINTIEDEYKEIQHNNEVMIQIAGDESDATLRLTSNYYSYIIWVFIMILIICLLLTNSTNIGDKVSSISYMVLAIFCLLFLIYLYRKFAKY